MRLGALAGSNSPFPEQQPSQHMIYRNTWINIISAPGNVSSHFFLMEIASGHLSHASSNMQMEENLVTNLVKHNVPGHELLPWCKFGDDHQFFLKRQSERVLGCEHWTPVFLFEMLPKPQRSSSVLREFLPLPQVLVTLLSLPPAGTLLGSLLSSLL